MVIVKRKTRKIFLSLSAISIVAGTTFAVVSCNENKTEKDTKDLAQVKKNNLITHNTTFQNAYNSYKSNFPKTEADFYKKYVKINQFFSQSSPLAKKLLQELKALNPENFVVMSENAQSAEDKKMLELYKFWFVNAKIPNTNKYAWLGNVMLDGAGEIIADAQQQIRDNLSYIHNNQNDLSSDSSLKSYFVNLGDKSIEDSTVQKLLTKSYRFIAQKIFNKDEAHDHDHAHHEENHSPNLEEHHHSHALINITSTSLAENEEIYTKFVELSKNYQKFSQFLDTSAVSAIKKFVDDNIAQVNSTLELIEEAEAEVKPLKTAFTSIYTPLKQMVLTLGLTEDKVLTEN